MIVLDENILDRQRLLLQAWGLPARQIGLDLGRKGLKDEEIIVLLCRQRGPTFFTRDADFYGPTFRHRSYCLVVASVGQNEVARVRAPIPPSRASLIPNPNRWGG